VVAISSAAATYAYVYLSQSAPRWPDGSVTMDLSLGSSGTLTDGCVDWGECAEHAMSLWNAQVENIQFRVRRNSPVQPRTRDGMNSVFWADDVFGSPFGDRTLAISLVAWSGRQMVEADVIFNRARSFDSYRGPLRTGTIDFRRVAVHEFGHVLGLSHPDESGQVVTAIMNAKVGNLESLTSDDVAGITSLYATAGPVTSAPSPSPRPLTVVLPSRDEVYAFRRALEHKYEADVHATPTLTSVDPLGDAAWLGEFARYRLFQCGYEEAVSRVFFDIDGHGGQPGCGTPTSSNLSSRDEMIAFRQRLETKYRNDLWRAPSPLFVDTTGAAVWTREYIQARVNGMTHASAQANVFRQIDVVVGSSR
jgi:hypothetical protein